MKYKKISSLILVTILLCTACSSPASQPKKKELELSKEEWEQLTFFCGEWVYTGDESMWTINIVDLCQ